MNNSRMGLHWQALVIGLAPLFAFLVGCADTEPTAPADSAYFTVVHPVSTDSLTILTADFSFLNPHACSGLNAFGYTEGLCGHGAVGVAPEADRSRIVEAVKQELVRNARFTGVAESSAVSVGAVGGTLRYVRISFLNQRWQGLEVLNTGITVHADSIGILAISGNHYEGIQVPPSPRVSARVAQASLIGLEIPWEDYTGQDHVYKINLDSFWGEPEKVILPRRMGDVIELRVVWSVPASMWKIYVDTMTREQLGMRQLAIF